ncbi:MAG: hypothetical protein ACE5LU_01025 [Anaerolineae bacterium]
MARKRKKRQKARQRKATRRKGKRPSRRVRSGAHPMLRMAGRWPLHEVLLTREWRGVSPDPDYRDAMLVLGDADPEACPDDIPLGGEDGKPFFVAGPYDDVPAIMAQLTKAVGPDGFTYLVPIDPDTEVFLDDDMWEED